ncbi:MAG: ABC-type transport auxiliary lipoprotein family protein [Deltaproteobacteria bacterium]|nr:ABC-type transport auxiliary lipoprotein family protein [Deltaproteobacteria bacterium]
MNALFMTSIYALAVLSVLVAGCLSIEKSYPDQHFFVLEVKRGSNPATSAGNGILEVAEVRISPRYSEKSFVYRTSEPRYESDFYNQFLVAPATIITEEIRKGLAQSQVFRHVIGTSNQLQPTHVLEAAVSALYGDFRNSGAPKAVLEMEFFLSKEGDGGSQVILEKRYAKSVDLNRRSPEALVQGWNRALEEVLATLIEDLRSAK